MAKPEYDLCVIGGGSAGLVAAAGAATLGAKVALLEKHKMGGDCLNYGCVPSKALLHSAKVVQTMRRAADAAIDAQVPEVSLERVMQRVRSVIRTIEPNDSPERFRSLGVEVIFGAGKFSGRQVFEVNGRALTARKFIVATGSRPAIPDIPGLKEVPYLTNETVFDLNEPVPRLIVLGGGAIGVELAQAFVRLGTDVHLVHRGRHILKNEDPELAEVVETRLRDEGVALHLRATPARVEGGAGRLRLSIKQADGTEQWLEGTHLLVATGRRANVEHLGLESAGVKVTHGRVVTDKSLRTANRDIYACGDVVGPYQFTHMAEHHAGIALRGALFHLPAKIEERVIPWCTFTDPELARVGLSETEAKAQGIACQAYTFPFHEVDRAITDGETAGLAKILTAPNGRLLGAAIVGPNAGELIHEYVLALSRNLKVGDLANVIHIYPTLAQINRRVANEQLKSKLTPGAKSWMKLLFRLRGT
ncbi:MAG TPA: FAD-dependent oxidoreductase [Novimethylophilus sp.]|jgi:pyruvate/2-oxoglutarate dehydrogenase complex dihydrolipoamide dehydrogenase (E3) component|uniref:dihydrolipoyl dehydrogenase family protein n=1 Tax=Novimethylophilus sp. TaxID=2137426 RepID=UPI002F414534